MRSFRSDKQSAKAVEKIIHKMNKIHCNEKGKIPFLFWEIEGGLNWKEKYSAIYNELRDIEKFTSDPEIRTTINHALYDALGVQGRVVQEVGHEEYARGKDFYESIVCDYTLNGLAQTLVRIPNMYDGYNPENSGSSEL